MCKAVTGTPSSPWNLKLQVGPFCAKQAHWACLPNTVWHWPLLRVPILLYSPASSTEKNAIDGDRNQHAPIDAYAHRPAPSLTPSAYLTVSTAIFSLMQRRSWWGWERTEGWVCSRREWWGPGAVVFAYNPSTHRFLLCSPVWYKLALLLS